ncbi:MAG TPA: hypothetical protein VLA72_12720 [Anaerolineales bacterium]|nr:hypothetical protein [Anaerolineales bacterium]
MARRKKEPLTDDMILDLESRLSGTLKPIQPSSDIIQRLRERIRFPSPEEIQMRLKDWRRMLLVLGGVMSGMLIVITIARAFFHLFGRRHM